MAIRDREICNGTTGYFYPSFERGHRLFWSFGLRGHRLFQCCFSTGSEIIFKYSDTGPWIIFNCVSNTGPITIFPSFPEFYTGPKIIFPIFVRDQRFFLPFLRKFPRFLEPWFPIFKTGMTSYLRPLIGHRSSSVLCFKREIWYEKQNGASHGRVCAVAYLSQSPPSVCECYSSSQMNPVLFDDVTLLYPFSQLDTSCHHYNWWSQWRLNFVRLHTLNKISTRKRDFHVLSILARSFFIEGGRVLITILLKI